MYSTQHSKNHPTSEKLFGVIVAPIYIISLILNFRLFGREVDGYLVLRDALNSYVRTQGSAIVINPEKDSTMVAELLQFKGKLDSVLATCFENNRSLIDTVHDAFKTFINLRKNRPAELIAKYVDHLMKSGNKGMI